MYLTLYKSHRLYKTENIIRIIFQIQPNIYNYYLFKISESVAIITLYNTK